MSAEKKFKIVKEKTRLFCEKLFTFERFYGMIRGEKNSLQKYSGGLSTHGN